MSKLKSILIFDANLQSETLSFDHSYYPYKMGWTFAWKSNDGTLTSWTLKEKKRMWFGMRILRMS